MLRVAGIYIALRVVLATLNPDIWSILDSFIELSTPVSSFRRLKEGLYLFNELQISPYSGGPCHQSPLLLALFAQVPSKLAFLAFTGVDVLAASALAQYARRNAQSSFSPQIVAACYLFNPFSLLSSLAQSTNVFSNALVCGALGAAATGHGARSMLLLGAATALSYYPLYLIAPLLLLARQNMPKASVLGLIGAYTVAVSLFIGLAYLPTQSWDFLSSQFGTQLLLGDLTEPNLGLWWYFFIELFDFFRPFFLGAFQLVLLAFPAPLTLRFVEQPLFVLGALTGVLAVLKPYPEASDFGLYITLLVLNKPVLSLLEYRPIEALGVCYVSALSPAFYYLWIYAGSGNANFFYSITLVYTVTMVVFLADSTWAAIRIGFDGGKSKSLIQI